MKTYSIIQKIIVMLIALLFSAARPAKAQITIPDPNFAAWLQTNYPSAMTGNILDDQDSTVLTADYLDIPDLGIADFTGLEAFVSLETLYITGNDLSSFVMPPFTGLKILGLNVSNTITTFPDVTSPVIETLYCFSCLNLTTLPTPPPSVRIYNFMNCPNLNVLPPLPTLLMVLDLTGSSIDVLPPINDALQNLHLDSNENIQFSFSSLTENSQLFSFSCDNINLTSLPDLTNFKAPYLICRNNQLTCLPRLPETVETLQVSGNFVTCLPNIPASLTSSDIGFTQCIPTSSGGTTNADCTGICNGEATVLTTPGPSLTYLWSNGQFTSGAGGISSMNNLCGGLNYVQVTDGINCSSWHTFQINNIITVSLTGISHQDVSCNGANDGSITSINATGGTLPYQYSIDGGITTQPSSVFNNLSAGTYNVTVIDANGCTENANVNILEPAPIVVNLGPDVTICPLMTVNLCATLPGATYTWSNGMTAPCIAVSAGVYTVTVTGMNGCTGSDSIEINTVNPPVASSYIIDLPDCGVCNGEAGASVTGGTSPYTFLWSTSTTTQLDTGLCENTVYTITVTDVNGCEDTVSFSLLCSGIWPGDANYDGVANNNDLLAIGVGYGTTGPSRLNPTINWVAQYCTDWTDTLSGGSNYKHIDCNGDGIITDDDTIAIIQNFGLNHPLRMQNTAGPNDPALFFDITVDTSGTSAQLSVPLHLGTAAVPAVDIYGVAFTVNYDTSLVKADSVSMDFTNCWITGTGHSLSIAVNDPLNGRLYAAITRTDHTDTTGFGEIGTFGIVTVDNISARLSGITSDTLILSLSNVQLIMHTGEEKLVNIGSDTLIINDNTVGLYKNIDEGNISVYPNPAGNYFIVNAQQQLNNVDVRIYNLLNEEVKVNYKSNGNTLIVNSSHLKSGLYIVNIKSDDGSFTFKLNKAQ